MEQVEHDWFWVLAELLDFYSQKLNATMVEYIYSFEDNICNRAERFRFYPLTKELRDLFLRHEPKEVADIPNYDNEFEQDLRSIPDAYGLIATSSDRFEVFNILTESVFPTE
jgi:hypothetical protein